MRNISLFISILLISTAMAHAQEVHFGAKAGVNFGQKGFHIGALAEFSLSESFALQPEVLYSSQETEREITRSYSGVDIDVTGTTKLDYINVPVIAKYYILDGLAVEAGPQIGFLVSAKGESELDLSDLDPDIAALIESGLQSGEMDISDRIKDFDIGLGIGGSYKLDMGLFFGARYNFGLLNANDSKYSDEYEIHNNVFQLSAGYSF